MRLTHRLELIKLTILIGILTSVILSFNLWAGDRWFPKTTFIENYIGMPVRYDYVNFCVLLTLLFFLLFIVSVFIYPLAIDFFYDSKLGC